jgi:MinD-like ATPase involved in chromosome partitioning or flagellar assembly
VTVPVLAAVSGASWEPALVAALEGGADGVTVVRRCVDLADLLAAAAAGTARAALVSADLRRLDRDALARLALAQVAVVGLFTPGDDVAESRLRLLGLDHVLSADTTTHDIAAAVVSSLAGAEHRRAPNDRGGAASLRYGDPSAALPDLGSAAHSLLGSNGSTNGSNGSTNGFNGSNRSHRSSTSTGSTGSTASHVPLVEPGSGRLVAVWGPTGAPGRTTVAVGIAGELALAGVPTLLADADTYGGSVAQVLGFLDEAPGLAAAARLANLGQLDLAALARVAPSAAPQLRVLTGISRAERWTELRPAALEAVWSLARSLAALTIVDCGFSLEQDEELSFDTAAPRRNGATLATLAAADTVLAVGAADPVGVQRLVRALGDLRDAMPEVSPVVVLTKVRRGVVGGEPHQQLAEALERYAGVRDVTFLPYDREPLDEALRQGRLLAEVAPDSDIRQALAGLAASLDGRPVPVRRRRLLRRG